ncbi:MAG: AglZ/HisF2 family acetamidino modification protein [Planctomycetota bacterium]|jgi:cyclase
MLWTRVMPCLLVQGGRLVKTVKFRNPAYVGDPVNAIKIFNEKEVDELILVDITATIERRRPNFQLLSEVAGECFMPLAYGGGIHDVEDIRRIFNLGIEKVAINSYAAENESFIREAADLFGSQSIVLSMDVKRPRWEKAVVCTEGGRNRTKLDPVTFARRMEAAGAGEILLTSIDRDGTWEGYDVELIGRVTDAVSVPVIACGGAGSVRDFELAVKKGNASAVAAGSMVVYQGKGLGVLINFPSADELKDVRMYPALSSRQDVSGS